MTIYVVSYYDGERYNNHEYFNSEYAAKVKCYHLNREDKIEWEDYRRHYPYMFDHPAYGYKTRKCFVHSYSVERVHYGLTKEELESLDKSMEQSIAGLAKPFHFDKDFNLVEGRDPDFDKMIAQLNDYEEFHEFVIEQDEVFIKTIQPGKPL